MESIFAPDEAATRLTGARLAGLLRASDVVLLEGPLGAGKTTLVRGLVEALGHRGSVRSPTFNLLQTFDTNPPVLHADLYRVQGVEGLGIEDYLSTHICLIEWSERAAGFFSVRESWHVRIAFEESGRRIEVYPPGDVHSIADAI